LTDLNICESTVFDSDEVISSEALIFPCKPASFAAKQQAKETPSIAARMTAIFFSMFVTSSSAILVGNYDSSRFSYSTDERDPLTVKRYAKSGGKLRPP
jgi:hypothetical protein